MKILYGIQGTGNGHITRARAMATALRNENVDVQFLVSGRPKEKLFDMEIFGDYWWREGLTFCAKNGRVALTETVVKSRPRQFTQDIRDLSVENFDLIITDYEPVTAWAGRRSSKRVLGLGHQYALGHKVPKARMTPIDKFILQNFAPADEELGLHWHHFGSQILPPIAPVHETAQLATMDSQETPYHLVYLPFESPYNIAKLLRHFKKTRFVIYHSEVQPKIVGNMEWRKPSRISFPHALAGCSGVICNAGFELASESLQLGKKLLVKPLAGQFEQFSNALSLESLGWGRAMMDLTPSITEEWIAEQHGIKVGYPDTAAAVAKYIAQGAVGGTADLVNELWQATIMPDAFILDTSVAA